MEKIMDKKNFIQDNIELSELYSIAPVLMAQEIDGNIKTPDDIAMYLYQGGKSLPLAFGDQKQDDNQKPSKKIWLDIKAEFNVFLCEDSPKYEVLWRKLGGVKAKVTPYIITTISVYLISELNISNSLSIFITQFIAILLFFAVKVGTSIYCKRTAKL